MLAIPSKRFTRTLIHFLTPSEVDALLAAPDQGTWSGRRDHAFLLVAVQTGLRLSEMTGLNREDVVLGTGAHVRVIGKGRNYDDLAIMHSSAPRTPVSCAAVVPAVSPCRGLCA